MSQPETPRLSPNGASRPLGHENIMFRHFVREEDRTAVVRMCRETGFFHEGEVAVAEELVLERLNKGPSSGYEFIFAERDGIVLGYACFGRIPCTQSSWDLYWIVVSPRVQRMGIGGRLLSEVERVIRDLGGTRVYIETSGRQQYRPTREFYEKHGYAVAAALEDFYAPGDPKIIYAKVL
jgi:GNAT superfamily N-acetyltransferase